MTTILARHLFDGSKIVEHAMISVDGSRIIAVSTACEMEKPSLEAEWVTPGFIDIGSGIGLKEESLGFEGNDLNEATDAVTPELQALDGISPYDRSLGKALMGGVTTALVLPGSSNVVGGRGAIVHLAGATADAMCVRSPFGVRFSLGDSPKIVHGQKRTPMTRMGNAFLIRDVLSRAREYAVKKKEFNMKYEALLPLLSGHDTAFFQAQRADDIMTAVRISEEFGLHYVLTGAVDADLVADQLASRGAAVAFGPVILSRTSDEVRRLHPENVASILKRGVKTAIISGHPEYPTKYLRLSLGLLIGRGITPEQALSSVTCVPAGMLGLEGYGVVQPGACADLALFRAQPWEPEGIVEHTFVAGQEVYTRS